MGVNRRDFFIGAAGLAVGAASCWCVQAYRAGLPNAIVQENGDHQNANLGPGMTPAEAMQKLMDGNRRFADGRLTHPHESVEWRRAVSAEQNPFAVILSCSDSRVVPELIFDEGLGDLFVVREAGNVADDDSLGSIEYAVGHFHIPLIFVLGHQRCGAIQAAASSLINDAPAPGHILRLVDDLAPAIREAQARGGPLIETAVRINTLQVAQRLRQSVPVLRPLVRRQQVRVVAGVYNMETGVVQVLNEE